jgi:hypothetical protein
MTPAQLPAGDPIRRLDSWKEIAEYLGRDVRTATRWESQGLPVHRVPGGKGSSVFAVTSEIDRWLAGLAPVALPAPVDAVAPRTDRRSHSIAAISACILLTIVIAATIVWRPRLVTRDAAPLRVSATAATVAIAGDSGAPRIIHRFDPGAVLVARAPARVTDNHRDGRAEVMVAVSFYENAADRSVREGELLDLSTDGRVRWRFAFDDVLTFRDGTVRGPWAMSEWQAAPAASAPRIAVAAHDFTWWASIVAVLDPDGRRLSTFVNPGWMESLLWLRGDRLAIAGFDNARNEAMLAVVDTAAGDRSAPGTAGTSFACSSCSPAPPLFYATFPRSELNVLTSGPFNRAHVAVIGDRVLVTTIEIANSNVAGIYEFDRELRFLRAQYSQSYWDTHRRLELEGKIHHSGDACPERDGPAAIRVWDARDGWLRVRPAGN